MTTPSTHRERKRLVTSERIRDCAMDLFEKQGYAETTIDQIAETAMVAPRTFFRYFPTKAAVVISAQAEWLAIFRKHSPLRPDESAIDGIRRIFLEIVRHIDADPEPAIRSIRLNLLSEEVLQAALVWELQWRMEVAKLVMERFDNPDDAWTLGGVTMAVVAGNLHYWANGDTSRPFGTMMLRGLDQIEHGFDMGRD